MSPAEKNGGKTSSSKHSTSSAPPPREAYAKLATQLLSCFRPTETLDPKVFLTAIVTILCEYRLADRDAHEQAKSTKRQTIHEIEDEMAARGVFMSGWRARQRPPETPESVRAKYNLTQDQWDAIEDAPTPGKGQHPDTGMVYTARDFHTAVERYGRPIGAFEPGRSKPYPS